MEKSLIIYLTLQDLKRLILDLQRVANDTLTPSKKYPMIAEISVKVTQPDNEYQDRLCLFLDLLDKHGEIWCSGAWNLENKEPATIEQELEALIISFIKETDPNRENSEN